MTERVRGPMGADVSADQILAQAVEWLEARPAQALEAARTIASACPGQPLAVLVMGIAHRRLHDTGAALAVLETLTHAQPKFGAAHYEHGLALAAAGRGEEAVGALRRAVTLSPDLPGAWRALGDHLTAIGDSEAADAAYAQHIRAATRNPRLMRAAGALCANEIPTAEALLRVHLREHPTDVVALRMLAEVAARIGRYADAEALLVRALELAPGFVEARSQYATVLNRQGHHLEALAQIDRLLGSDPDNPQHRNLKATLLVTIGEYRRAIELYARLVEEYPRQGKVWLNYGHVLKTAGHQEDAIQAFRKCLEILPGLSEAWFTLANMKTFRFTPDDVAAMRAALNAAGASDTDRLHLHFALGKACEDAAHFEQSFQHYAEGNRLRRGQINYRAQDTTQAVERSRALFTPEFFSARAGSGSPCSDPIFIVGLPRSGSTLVEQILSSHSQVEGTMELYDMIDLARSVGSGVSGGAPVQYPDGVARLGADDLRALGEAYLERTRVQRKTSAQRFIDKMPNNFLHVGLIALALPNARIIDVRRHPLSCCFSVFKQHFARGQHFSYDLADIASYYSDYVRLMAHFDEVMPGRVHRVHYEALVEDTETQVRALLDYCGLPFEARCLRFHENERAVRTASSEQVRQPIFRDGLEQWRHYERWLEPLRVALGPLLEAYPVVRPRAQGAGSMN